MALAIKHVPPPKETHSHKCCVCAHLFICEYTRDECASKGVLKSVEVNKDGPYCLLCYHMTMAVRVSALRKLKQQYITKLVGKIWSREKNRPDA